MQKRKRVVVIGAGYGGLRAVEHLSKDARLEVILIDKHPYHYLQTEVYGYIAGRFDLHDVALDLQNWCHGFKPSVNFVQDEIIAIDEIAQSIKGGNDTSYGYDFLIIATGAKTHFFSFIPGLKEHSFGVKELSRAFDLRTAFERLLYDKVIHPHSDTLHINIAIGGAGLSGVEIAAEMAYVIKKHTKSIGESAKEIHIYLIDAGSTILPGMSPYIIQHTQKRLDALGVVTLTDTFIESMDQQKIYFKGGADLAYHLLIFTGGIEGNRVESHTRSAHNKAGQYIVDDQLRLAPNIFAIGDCIEMKNPKGEILPPTAQTAEKSAQYVAKNIIKLISGKKCHPYKEKIDGFFVALGGHYAVGEMFDFIRVRGNLAFVLKKYIAKSYYLGLKFRLNTGFKKRTRKRKD